VAAYPEAGKVRLVLDNLNTHNASAFYENMPADEAFALAQRFEFFYTPKSASWLNMIEIEFSALSRQCLQRRIPTRELLCRQKLNSRYSIVNEANSKFMEVPVI
jgi:hypothetical protein